MDPNTEEQFENVDATVFSGDRLHTRESVDQAIEYVERWQRELSSISKNIEEERIT